MALDSSGVEAGVPVATPPVLTGAAIGVPRPPAPLTPPRTLLARICAALDVPFASLTSQVCMYDVARERRGERLDLRICACERRPARHKSVPASPHVGTGTGAGAGTWICICTCVMHVHMHDGRARAQQQS